MTSCTITFHNNPERVCYAGQSVSGAAKLTTNKVLSLRGAYITINGFCKVRWSKRQGRRTRRFTSFEQYLDSKTCVLGREGGEKIELQPGTHTFNFREELPIGLPSSFVGEFGHIRYEVVLTVDRQLRFNITFRQPFTVISALDLNSNPGYKKPLYQESENLLSSCCFSAAPLDVSCHIPYSGYAAGQRIPFRAMVKNTSNIDCLDAKAMVVKHVRFVSTDPYSRFKLRKFKVTETALGAVPKQSDKEFKEFLQLPATPASTLNTSSLIEVCYSVVLRLYMPRCHRNIKLSLPITIGTFPIRERTTTVSSELTTYSSPPANSVPMPYSPLPANSDPASQSPTPHMGIDDLPPTYEEAMADDGAAHFVDEDEDDDSFLPKYPVFYESSLPGDPPS